MKKKKKILILLLYPCLVPIRIWCSAWKSSRSFLKSLHKSHHNVWCTSFQEPSIESQHHVTSPFLCLHVRVVSHFVYLSWRTDFDCVLLQMVHVKNSTSACALNHIRFLQRLGKMLRARKDIIHNRLAMNSSHLSSMGMKWRGHWRMSVVQSSGLCSTMLRHRQQTVINFSVSVQLCSH